MEAKILKKEIAATCELCNYEDCESCSILFLDNAPYVICDLCVACLRDKLKIVKEE